MSPYAQKELINKGVSKFEKKKFNHSEEEEKIYKIFK